MELDDLRLQHDKELLELISGMITRMGVTSARIDNLLDNQKTTSDIIVLLTNRLIELEANQDIMLRTLAVFVKMAQEAKKEDVH